METKKELTCKICSSNHLTIFAHTAKCKNCGTLLFYPYPENHALEIDSKEESIIQEKHNWFWWYSKSSRLNHLNFTNMFLFSIEKPENLFALPIKVLDYGGGGGQFAFVCKSFLPLSEVFITDISDYALLENYRLLNNQIKWNDFQKDKTTFEYIFLNDVFEHVNDPLLTLKILFDKLTVNGKLFIDTPKQFWLYTLLKFVHRPLYTKLLKGTVSKMHLQIWTNKSFLYIIDKAGFKVDKYVEINEFTMNADFYLRNMGINNKILLFIGNLFYKTAKLTVRNKIMCLIVKK